MKPRPAFRPFKPIRPTPALHPSHAPPSKHGPPASLSAHPRPVKPQVQAVSEFSTSREIAKLAREFRLLCLVGRFPDLARTAEELEWACDRGPDQGADKGDEKAHAAAPGKNATYSECYKYLNGILRKEARMFPLARRELDKVCACCCAYVQKKRYLVITNFSRTVMLCGSKHMTISAFAPVGETIFFTSCGKEPPWDARNFRSFSISPPLQQPKDLADMNLSKYPLHLCVVGSISICTIGELEVPSFFSELYSIQDNRWTILPLRKTVADGLSCCVAQRYIYVIRAAHSRAYQSTEFLAEVLDTLDPMLGWTTIKFTGAVVPRGGWGLQTAFAVEEGHTIILGGKRASARLNVQGHTAESVEMAFPTPEGLFVKVYRVGDFVRRNGVYVQYYAGVGPVVYDEISRKVSVGKGKTAAKNGECFVWIQNEP